MKCVEKMAHNRADEIVPQQLLDEIIAAIQEANGGGAGPILAALAGLGWQTEAPVAPELAARFDALKEGVAVEIERNLTDYAFREWVYFQRAHVAGRLVAGVHIVPRKPKGDANCYAKWVHSTLESFSAVFCVPVLILGVDL